MNYNPGNDCVFKNILFYTPTNLKYYQNQSHNSFAPRYFNKILMLSV